MVARCIFVLNVIASGVWAVDPLSEADAIAAEARLKQLMDFSAEHFTKRVSVGINQCKAAASTFKTQCTDQNVQQASCKEEKCSNTAYSTKAACDAATDGWWMEEDKNGICCSDGEVKCENDENGKERNNHGLFSCCAFCFDDAVKPADTTDADWELQQGACTEEGALGPSVCGTTQGKCYSCKSGDTFIWDTSSEGDCTNWGGTWAQETSYTSKEACQAGVCYTCSPDRDRHSEQDCKSNGGNCSDSAYDNQGSCQGAGHTWTDGVWSADATKTDSDACEAGSSRRRGAWIKKRYYEDGSELIPDGTSYCSTGPSHREPTHILPTTCVDKAMYLADAAAGMTAEAAYLANTAYYNDQIYHSTIPRARVVNHADAAERANFTFSGGTMCFIAIVEPFNSGTVAFAGSSDSFFLILKPQNNADSDGLTISGGSASVLGGTSAGAIVSTTTDTLEIYGVTNSGPITVTGSQDIIIANVTNEASAALTVTDVSATLINIVNHGTVEVKGPDSGAAQGGKYNAYNIANTGTVIIHAGVVNLNFICPETGSAGTVELKDGVTGTISYADGCQGTMTVPTSGVTSTVVTPPPTPSSDGVASGAPPTLLSVMQLFVSSVGTVTVIAMAVV